MPIGFASTLAKVGEWPSGADVLWHWPGALAWGTGLDHWFAAKKKAAGVGNARRHCGNQSLPWQA
ncbi:hypothetical protein [Desulfovibrio sp.]|uniref:hypothetical protein n=1 Tax=Desulfovibrio sp. TaxID=885 RepID=UPI0035ADC493